MRIIIFDCLPSAELADLVVPPSGGKMGLARVVRNGTMLLVEEDEYMEYNPLMWEMVCPRN